MTYSTPALLSRDFMRPAYLKGKSTKPAYLKEPAMEEPMQEMMPIEQPPLDLMPVLQVAAQDDPLAEYKTSALVGIGAGLLTALLSKNRGSDNYILNGAAVGAIAGSLYHMFMANKE